MRFVCNVGWLAQLYAGTTVGAGSPAGFATLDTLKELSADVRAAGVAVFGRPSGKESLIIKVKVCSAVFHNPASA